MYDLDTKLLLNIM